jgi:RNA polymerase sigma factor (sigma-70 family)
MTASVLAAGISASDEVLVAAVRAGDDTAFEELYRRYRRRISSFLNRFVHDEGRAEDLAQEAFMSALRRLRATDSEINFKPWIYEIARNGAIDHHRRASRAEEISMDADHGLRPADQLRLVGSVAPESALFTKDTLDRLRRAFAELSESHERILVLRELEGLSYREIAERMDLSRPAVESTLFRARRRLEYEFAEDDAGRRCAAMRVVLARLAEGVDVRGEERRAARHLRRCASCRLTARELGVDPKQGATLRAKAAALLPLPFLRPRSSGADVSDGHASTPSSAGSGWTMLAGPGADLAAHAAAKAAALVAALALVGGGGATLGGVGPLAPPMDRPAGKAKPGSHSSPAAGSRAASAAARRAESPSQAGRTRGSAQPRSSPTPSGGPSRQTDPGPSLPSVTRSPAGSSLTPDVPLLGSHSGPGLALPDASSGGASAPGPSSLPHLPSGTPALPAFSSAFSRPRLEPGSAAGAGPTVPSAPSPPH